MKRRKLIALLCALLATFLLVGFGRAESGDAVDALLQTWKDLYGETDEWNSPEFFVGKIDVPQPDENDIHKEEALEIAIRNLLLFLKADADALARYRPFFGFLEMHEWSISFDPVDIDLQVDWFHVTVDGRTGDVVEIVVSPPPIFDSTPGGKG